MSNAEAILRARLIEAEDRVHELDKALWECLLLSGADVSSYAHETRTRAGLANGFHAWRRINRGPSEVVEAVRRLRDYYEES